MKTKILYGLGMGVLLATFLMFSWTFILAFYNGVNGNGYKVVMDISSLNEQFLELGFLIMSVPLVLFTFVQIIKHLKRTEQESY